MTIPYVTGIVLLKCHQGSTLGQMFIKWSNIVSPDSADLPDKCRLQLFKASLPCPCLLIMRNTTILHILYYMLPARQANALTAPSPVARTNPSSQARWTSLNLATCVRSIPASTGEAMSHSIT